MGPVIGPLIGKVEPLGETPIRPERTDLPWTALTILGKLQATGKPAEALNAFLSALAIRQKLADANPTVAEFQSALAASHNSIGDCLSATGKPAEAQQAVLKAAAVGVGRCGAGAGAAHVAPAIALFSVESAGDP